MSTNDSGIRDEVQARVGDAPEAFDREFSGEPATLPPLPDRPADGAKVEAWVDYCVALGADRTFLTTTTYHETGDGALSAPALKRAELIKLADRLGG